jgi:hypothetical protein
MYDNIAHVSMFSLTCQCCADLVYGIDGMFNLVSLYLCVFVCLFVCLILEWQGAGIFYLFFRMRTETLVF